MTTDVIQDATWQVSILRDAASLRALRDEWHALLVRSGAAEIFQTPEWLMAWWDVFGGGDRQLFVIIVRDGDRLMGLAPLLLHTVRSWGPTRVRRLEFIGTGEPEEDEVCSDFQDIVAEPDHMTAVAAHVWRRLMAARADWDEALFANVLDQSVLARHLGPLARNAALTTRTLGQSERFFINLADGDFDTYLGRLSKKRRKRIAYCQRRLDKEGQLTEQRLQHRDEIPAFLAELARLNILRRTAQKKPSAFSSGLFKRFHELVAPQLWDLGWLDLRLWWRHGRCVAGLYNIVFGGTVYHYQSGFDTQAFGNLSPGLVTLVNAIQSGFENRCRRFDFQLGGKGSYKEDYGCETAATVRLVVYNDSAAAHVMRGARDLRQALRALRERYIKRRAAV